MGLKSKITKPIKNCMKKDGKPREIPIFCPHFTSALHGCQLTTELYLHRSAVEATGGGGRIYV
jgi:hypothetical protein